MRPLRGSVQRKGEASRERRGMLRSWLPQYGPWPRRDHGSCQAGVMWGGRRC